MAEVKYEEVYLHEYETVSAATAGIARYLQFFITRLRALDRQIPDTVYFTSLLRTVACLTRRDPLIPPRQVSPFWFTSFTLIGGSIGYNFILTEPSMRYALILRRSWMHSH